AVRATQLDLVDAWEGRDEAVGRSGARVGVVLGDVTVDARTLAAKGAGHVELLAKHEALDLTEIRLVADGLADLRRDRRFGRAGRVVLSRRKSLPLNVVVVQVAGRVLHAGLRRRAEEIAERPV